MDRTDEDRADREPLPGDGPDFHADHVAWTTRQTDRWNCPRCGSTRWVAASLTGPVSHGGRAIRQCVPCGHYSGDPVPA